MLDGRAKTMPSLLEIQNRSRMAAALDGGLSDAEFEGQARQFVELLAPSGLGWAWVDGGDRPGYVCGSAAVPAPCCPNCAAAAQRSAQLESAVDADALWAEEGDAAARRCTSDTQQDAPAHRVHYHIVLDPTFCQPTLLVLARHCDGSALSTDEVWAHLSADMHAHRNSPFVFTEVEHPVLGTPCFALHPCRTENLMALMRSARSAGGVEPSGGGSYLVSWWSTIAPIVRLPNRLCWYHPTVGH